MKKKSTAILIFVLLLLAACSPAPVTTEPNPDPSDNQSQPEGFWGPERETFTMEEPAGYPTLNSITDNPALGDERNFVRVAENGQGGVFTNEIEVVPGHEYEVYIAYHNNAAGNLNSSGKGIAQQVRLSVQFTSEVSPEKKGEVSAIISASNTNPQEVWSGSYFIANSTVSLRYKEGSAKIYNSGEADGQVLPETLFSEEGTYLGVNDLDGWLPGCAEWSGHIILTLIAE